MTPDIGMTQVSRNAACSVLRDTLATLMVASVHTRQAHWSTTGPNFSGLHALYGSQYDQIDQEIDLVAERIRALGGQPFQGPIQSLLDESEIKDGTFLPTSIGNIKHGDWTDIARRVLSDNEKISKCLREYIEELEGKAIEDCASAQILLDMLIHHDKQCWLLRSHLEG